MRGFRVRLAVGVLGSLIALGGEAIALAGGRAPSAALLHLAIGMTYIHGGIALWAHEPANRTGRLMTLVGLTWFIGTLTFAGTPLVSEVGLALEDSFSPILFALVLAYPTGRFIRRIDVAAVAVVAVAATALNVLYSTSLPIITDKSGGLYGGLALATMISIVVVLRWVSAPRSARRDLLPVLVAGLVFTATLGINIVRRIAHVPDEVAAVLVAAKDLAPAAIPIALLVGFYRQSERRSQALVDAIPDRMLRFDRSGAYISTNAVGELPADTSLPNGRRLHELLLAAAEPRVLAAAQRALQSGTMQSFDVDLDLPDGPVQLEARIAPSGPDEVTAIVRDFTGQRSAEAELRRSRARIVDAADTERRRLERDLHDGAQQRLVSVTLALRTLRTRLAAPQAVSGEAIPAVDDAASEVKLAIADLRELARGIHPAILTEAGLGAAMTSLAQRSAVPTTVADVPDRSLPIGIEATAYFVISEALANVAKYAEATSASVSATCDGESLRVEIRDNGLGGADSSKGTGIRGLQDRVAALGGRLSIDSPAGGGTLVLAEIPTA